MKEEIGNKPDIASSLSNIGVIYDDKGELDQALDYYQQSLTIYKEFGNPLRLSGALLSIIILMLIKDREIAHQYLIQLQAIAIENLNKEITQQCQFAEALMLKSSNRARSIAKAHDILEEISKDEIIDFALTSEVMLNLCEILLIEYKNFEENAVLTEVHDLLDQLYERAQEQHSFSLSIEVSILKARIEIMHGEFEQASRLLEQGYTLADEKGITGLIPKIEQEQQRMRDNIDTWKNMLDKTASVRERMEVTQFDEYLEMAIGFSERK